jgi:hypothetical protein
VCPVVIWRTGASQAAWRWAFCCRLVVPYLDERRPAEASRKGIAGGA